MRQEHWRCLFSVSNHILLIYSLFFVILLCNAIRAAIDCTTVLHYYITSWLWPIWRLLSATFNVNARPWWPLYRHTGHIADTIAHSLTHDDKSIKERPKGAGRHLATHQTLSPSTGLVHEVPVVSVCHLHMVTFVWATVTTKLISHINEQ